MATEALRQTPVRLAHERSQSPGYVRLVGFFGNAAYQGVFTFEEWNDDKRTAVIKAIADFFSPEFRGFPSPDGAKESLLIEAAAYLHERLPQDLQIKYPLFEMQRLLPNPAPGLIVITDRRAGIRLDIEEPAHGFFQLENHDEKYNRSNHERGRREKERLEVEVLDLLGWRNPYIRDSSKFFKAAEARGFKTRKVFLQDPARRFLLKACADGAFVTVRDEIYSPERWELVLAVFAYYTFTDASFEDIGKIFGYTSGTMPARVFKKFTRALFDYSLPEVKQAFDIDKIDFTKNEYKKKPVVRSDDYKDKLSFKKGGARRQIRLLVANNITDPLILSKLTGVSLAQVGLLVQRLRRQGAKGLEKSKVMENRALEASIVGAKSREDLKKVLAQKGVNFSFVKTRGDLFYSLQGLLRSHGARFSSRELDIINTKLVDAGFCALKLEEYYFPKHREEIRAAIVYLKRECNLLFLDDSNKYYQLAGPQIEKPAHMDNKRNAVCVLEELRRMGILDSAALDDCPYPVFVYSRRGLVVGKEYYEQFINWVKKSQGLSEQEAAS